MSQQFRRALVILCDGLTVDSTGRTLPEVRRAAEVHKHPDDPDHQPELAPARQMASPFYHIRARGPLDSPHDRAIIEVLSDYLSLRATAAAGDILSGSSAKARSFRKSPAGLGDSVRWLDCGLDGARVADTKAGRRGAQTPRRP